jgi:hypothetical protein
MFSRILTKFFCAFIIFFHKNRVPKSLGNAAFLAVQTEQVMHILQVFLQKTTKSSQNGKRLLFFCFLMKRQFWSWKQKHLCILFCMYIFCNWLSRYSILWSKPQILNFCKLEAFHEQTNRYTNFHKYIEE